MIKQIRKHAAKLAVGVGSAAALATGAIARAAEDTDVTTPIQNFIDYAKENTLAVIGIVLLGVGAIFAVSLGIALAFRWFKRAAK